MERQWESETKTNRQTIAALEERLKKFEGIIEQMDATVVENTNHIEAAQEEQKQTAILFSGALKVCFFFFSFTPFIF